MRAWPAALCIAAGCAGGQGSAAPDLGARPVPLLEGVVWVVEDLDRRGIIDRSRATLEFAADGKLSGRASCNLYTAGYELAGGGLTITEPAVTRRACAPSLMEQERRFLDLLARTRRYSMDRYGKLVLQTGDGGTITATRE